jgi:hypothetical protein
MAGINDVACPICTEHHTFCIADSDTFDSNVEYAFTCPTTRAVGRLKRLGWATIEETCPRAAVLVHRTSEGQ